jgi:hypothetical protein
MRTVPSWTRKGGAGMGREYRPGRSEAQGDSESDPDGVLPGGRPTAVEIRRHLPVVVGARVGEMNAWLDRHLGPVR